MSGSTTERILEAYLAPEGDRLPERVIAAALADIARTPQRRALGGPRRYATLPTHKALAFASITLAVAVAVAGAVLILQTYTGVGGPSSPPASFPTPPSSKPTPSATASRTTTLTGRIAFVRDGFADTNTDIWTMGVDGTNLARLTTMTSPEEGPAWSPDGARIAFVVGDTAAQVWIMNADGTDQHALTRNAFPAGRQVDWSPDGSQIVFFDAEHGGLYVMKADGSGVRAISLPAPAGSPRWTSGDQYPTWSPDGTRIAFINDGAIYTVHPDGTDRVLYAAHADPNLAFTARPAWSPNGSQIAVEVGGAIGLQNDSSLTNLTADTTVASPGFATWSPDGRWIVFSGEGAKADLYVIDVDGTGLRTLLASPYADYDPAWSPR